MCTILQSLHMLSSTPLPKTDKLQINIPFLYKADWLLNLQFTVVSFLGIFMLNHSYLEVFNIKSVSLMIPLVSDQQKLWILCCYRNGARGFVPWRRHGAKVIEYNHLQVYICIIRTFFLCIQHSLKLGTAAATAHQSELQIIPKINTDYSPLIFQWLHLTF